YTSSSAGTAGSAGRRRHCQDHTEPGSQPERIVDDKHLQPLGRSDACYAPEAVVLLQASRSHSRRATCHMSMTGYSYSNSRRGGTTMIATPADLMQTFEHQWAAQVTTYRRDGTGVATPIHLAVDGDHGYFGTASDAAKVKRIRRDPTGQVAACSASGKVTGP